MLVLVAAQGSTVALVADGRHGSVLARLVVLHGSVGLVHGKGQRDAGLCLHEEVTDAQLQRVNARADDGLARLGCHECSTYKDD